MKKIATALLIAIMLISCSRTIVRISYPQRFEGLTQLTVASETTNISFTDTLKKKFLFIKISEAQIRIDANVTFDFYVDFKKDGYQISIDSTNNKLTFVAPPIRVKKPQYNSRQVSYPDRGIFVNEDKEALRILNKVADKVIEKEGYALLNEPRVIEKCREELKNFIRDLCTKLGYEIDTIEVKFYQEENIIS